MEIVLVLIIALGVVTALIARSKGYSPVEWFVFGAALAIVALPMILLMRPSAKAFKRCPHCQEVIRKAAAVCPRCTREQPAMSA